MDISVQAHSLKYLKQQKRFEQKKIRNLRRLWNENVFYTNKMAAFARIRSQGISIKKLLWKFYKYNEMEKIHILSLHAVLERYFVDIEIRNAEFVVKRLVINEKLDQLIRSVAYGNGTNAPNTSVSFAVQQFCEHFDSEKNLILLLAVHSLIKKRLVDIEARNDELIGSYYEVNARLNELTSYDTDDLE